MKNLLMLAVAAVFMISCQNDEVSSPDNSFVIKASRADYSGYPATVQTVSGYITTNTTWTNDRVWEIDGVVLIKGATLTIQPGTFIKAKPLTEGSVSGVLVISKTGKIDAQGTANAPIIFTSYKLLDGNAATTAIPGDFGGVVLLGDANVNNGLTTNVVEGLYNMSDFYYGGSNNSHNAGVLNYIRIEFPGVVSYYGGYYNELNGLTCGAVGSGTFIDHIQVSYGKEDSFGFLGGKVNVSHLVSFAPDDDSFDFNVGYTGKISKAIAIADSNSYHKYILGYPDSNGIESDNNGAGSSTLIITRPVISQMSIIGVSSSTAADSFENAIQIRRLGQISLIDVTVTGYNTGIRWESPSLPSSSLWSGIYIHGFDNPVLPAGTNLGLGNVISTANPGTACGLTQPFFNNGTLNFTGATGAFKTEANWTSNWTKFTNF